MGKIKLPHPVLYDKNRKKGSNYLCKSGLDDPNVRNLGDTVHASHVNSKWCPHPTLPLLEMVASNTHTCINIELKILRRDQFLSNQVASNRLYVLLDRLV